MALLDVEGLVAGYEGLRILQGVSLAVDPGQIVAVVGPNGTGKSTLLKSVFGLVRPAAGKIHFSGADLTAAPPGDKLRRGMSYVPQGRNIFPLMSVDQNLELGGHILPDRDMVRRALDKVYALFPQLQERRHQRISELSGGLIQLLQVARAFLLEPRLILFDEPSLGLSPILVRELFDLITESTAKERPSCWSSRTPTKPWTSPIMGTSWNSAQTGTKVRLPCSERTNGSSASTSAGGDRGSTRDYREKLLAVDGQVRTKEGGVSWREDSAGTG
jgi:branched-chain amino acid transport system ATP-binding protein